jgi:ribosomal protein S18 acetylase RimI-like enzyme
MIEKPQPEDVPLIERMARETGAFTEIEVGTVREMLETFLHPEPRDDHTFVVYRNGESNSIQAFACYGPIALTDCNWDLYWICVERCRQGSGIGSRLLAAIEQDVREQHGRAVYLETSDSTLYRGAREFYERNGYQVVAHIDDFYTPGEGKVIYRKVLANVPPRPTP